METFPPLDSRMLLFTVYSAGSLHFFWATKKSTDVTVGKVTSWWESSVWGPQRVSGLGRSVVDTLQPAGNFCGWWPLFCWCCCWPKENSIMKWALCVHADLRFTAVQMVNICHGGLWRVTSVLNLKLYSQFLSLLVCVCVCARARGPIYRCVKERCTAP